MGVLLVYLCILWSISALDFPVFFLCFIRVVASCPSISAVMFFLTFVFLIVLSLRCSLRQSCSLHHLVFATFLESTLYIPYIADCSCAPVYPFFLPPVHALRPKLVSSAFVCHAECLCLLFFNVSHIVEAAPAPPRRHFIPSLSQLSPLLGSSLLRPPFAPQAPHA